MKRNLSQKEKSKRLDGNHREILIIAARGPGIKQMRFKF